MSTGLDRESWDVVVVGGGSAGAALAARLSEDPDRTVLLLEAGRDYRAADAPPELNGVDPLALLDQERFPEFQWLGLQARNTKAQELVHYPRGRGLGGSSAMNGRVALRPPLNEFESWARAGGERWGPDAVLGVFNALEDDLEFGDRAHHGKGGPITISRQDPRNESTAHRAFRDAALEIGIPPCEDINAPDATGVSRYTYNGVAGDRRDTNAAYLESARERPNLDVVGGALVDRVLMEGTRAVGVRALVGGQERSFSGAEIVICAGAIHSPAILQRSGIGPAATLDALGIPVLLDLPVGHGLQDHPSAAVVMPLAAEGYEPPRDALFLPLVRVSSGEPDVLSDDLALHGVASADPELFPYVVMAAILNQPTSTGTVRVRSSDPKDHPEIELNQLSTESDLTRLRIGVRMLLALARTSAMQSITTGPPQSLRLSWGDEPEIGQVLDGFSDEDLERWLFETSSTGQHPSSTCALGSVVGSDAVVLGAQGLRVADMSIAPTVPRANTNLTAIMIGEQVARIMR